MPVPETPAPTSVTVTCLTCHERMGVSLTAKRQTICCTFCNAPVNVPSREEVLRKQVANNGRSAAEIGEYSVAAVDDPATASAPQTAPKRAGGKKPGPPAVPTVTLECHTCHELVKAEVGAKPGRIACTFCGVVLPVPDLKTVEARRTAKVEPRPAKEIGEYAAGPVPVTPAPRRGNVFDRLAEIRREEIPDAPRWTFFSGVFTLPWQRETLSRWVYASFGFTAIVGIALVLKGLAAEFSGFASGAAMAFFVLPIIWILLFTISYSAACSMHVLEATAGGLDKIDSWPEPSWREWMPEMIYLGWVGAIPLAISYGLALAAQMQGVPLFVTLPAAFFILYPISLLSALEANTIWVPLTLPILTSLARWWWCWILFYCLAGLVVGGLLAAAIFLLRESLDGCLLALGPLLAAAPLIYFRLLGRLAWRMTAKK